MIDSIGFDLDGTLWDYADRYAGIFAQVLQGRADIEPPTVKAVRAATGLPALAYIEALFPRLKDADEAEKMRLFRQAETIGCARILERGGRLYDGLEQMLCTLSKRYRLFIASNCEPLYLLNFLQYYGFSPYFTDTICQNLPGAKPTKGENIRLVCERNGFCAPLFVGDAQSDADAARAAGVPFVWASYGYGRVADAAYRIDAPSELVPLTERL